jgi:AcrR family transcriptional regulator
MARTLDPVAHAVRREAFLDTATRLIQTKGYERLSVQDVIAEVSASKGAFYHYFGSKDDLLEGVVLRLVDAGLHGLEPAVADPTASALDKFESLFAGLADFKAGQQDLILGFLRSWMSDDNTVLRERFRRVSKLRLAPLLAAIVEQGVGEGSFTATDPRRTGEVLAALFLAVNEAASELFVGWLAGELTHDQVVGPVTAYVQAFERILGAPPGALGAQRRIAVLRTWFDAAAARFPADPRPADPRPADPRPAENSSAATTFSWGTT